MLASSQPRVPMAALSATERLERLQALGEALGDVAPPATLAERALDHAMPALAARAASVWIVASRGDSADLLAERGWTDDQRHRFGQVPLRNTPVGDAIQSGQAVWLSSRAAYRERYPALVDGGGEQPELSLVALPLLVHGTTIGAMAFTFEAARALDEQERRFVAAMARACAQALERARLYEQERATTAALARAHHTLEVVVASSPAAIMLLDADGTVRLWNEAATRTFGWTAEEAVGRFLPTVPHDERAEVLTLFQAVAGGLRVDGAERRALTRDRGPVDLALWAAPVQPQDGPVQCLCVVVDVSERKRAARGHELLARIGGTLSTALDPEATVREVVKLLVPFAATSCQVQLLDGDGGWQGLASEGAPPFPLPSRDTSGSVREHLAAGRSLRFARFDQQMGTGAQGFEHLTDGMILPLLARGRLLGGLVLTRPAAERDQLEPAVLEEVARRIAIALDNARLYRAAQDAIHQRDEFLSIASHELKTPLTSLDLYLNLFVRDAETGRITSRSPAAIAERAQKASAQVDRLTRLINELLDVSRVTSGRLRLQLGPVNLTELAGEVQARFSAQANASGCTLHLHADGPVTGVWDRDRLDQVLTNLIANALKYGGRRPVEVRVASHSFGARVTVQDRGVGIAPEDQRRIFDRFERTAAARNVGGMGLGLWIVKQIVEAHGGSVTVESAVGVGSTFLVDLPREALPSPPA